MRIYLFIKFYTFGHLKRRFLYDYKNLILYTVLTSFLFFLMIFFYIFHLLCKK